MREIKDKLERVGALVESGDALERDLALGLLREVYAAIKFGAGAETEASTETEPDPMQESEEFMEPVAPVEPVIPEPVVEAMESAIPVVPRRVAPEVIRSLYGPEDEGEDENAEAANRRSLGISERSDINLDNAAPASDDVVQGDAGFASEPQLVEPDPVEKPRATLGDAMAAGHRTLGETLRGSERDMASHLAAAERPGLKRSIGLNDRFLVIRDMFDGDADAFDRAIAKLDAFTDLDEAVIWMHDNFDLGADSKGAALLVEILERKLGR